MPVPIFLCKKPSLSQTVDSFRLSLKSTLGVHSRGMGKGQHGLAAAGVLGKAFVLRGRGREERRPAVQAAGERELRLNRSSRKKTPRSVRGRRRAGGLAGQEAQERSALGEKGERIQQAGQTAAERVERDALRRRGKSDIKPVGTRNNAARFGKVQFGQALYLRGRMNQEAGKSARISSKSLCNGGVGKAAGGRGKDSPYLPGRGKNSGSKRLREVTLVCTRQGGVPVRA